MTAALEVTNLVRRFGGLTAVDDVSFTVQPGEICGFIGPNGAGKTTTMRICATLDVPDEGDVHVDGISSIDDARAARTRLGFMPDSIGTYPNTTVEEFLDFFARAHGRVGADRERAVLESMAFTRTEGMRGKLVGSLSKGMGQRLCLAKTLLHDPAVLILDEPAAGLDPRARVELRELVTAMADMGKSVLISSHILSELGELCDTIVVIEKGRVRAQGSMADVGGGVSSRVIVRVLDEPDTLERTLLEQPHVQRVTREGEAFVIDLDATPEQRADLLATLVRRDIRVTEFAARQAGLEDVFLSLTEGEVQ